MTQPIFYCRSWFRAKKKPTELWPARQAETAHRNGQPYTALVGSVEAPYCLLNVTDTVIGVGFLDGRLRESLTYAFKKIDVGRLFLIMVVHREFEDETDKVGSGVTYMFDQSGELRIRREFFDPHRVETATSSFDPAANYVVMPRFGQYDDLVRVDRR